LANRGPPWKLIMGVFTAVTVGAIAASFLIPGPAEAPRDPGVCWRMTMAGTKPAYHRVAGNIANLETCSAYLEREFLIGHRPVDGAYQGRFIFIDGDAVRSAATLDGSRWRVFFDPQRAAVDKTLRSGGRTITITVATSPAR
jgi:hypothetical protein